MPGTAPTRGAADVDVTPGRISLRVADIVDQIALHPAQLDAATMHGRMQIDEFSALYDWRGTTLRFSDAEKDVRYKVRIDARTAAAR